MVTALILASAIAYISAMPKRYSSTSSVTIEVRKSDPREGARANIVPPSTFIDTQILVIRSPEIAAQVVKAMNLADDPEFGASLQSATGARASDQTRVALAAQKLMRALDIHGSGTSARIEIKATSLLPVRAARIANEFAGQYLASISASTAAADRLAISEVDARLTELRQDAERADADLQQYKIANSQLRAQGTKGAQQAASALDQQIASARANLVDKQGQLAAARSRGTSSMTPGSVAALRQTEAEAIRTLAQLKIRYGERHPDVIQAEQKLADTRQQIQLENNRFLSTLEAEVTAAQSVLSSLLQNQGQDRSRVAGNTASQVGLAELERRATAAKADYDGFMASSKGAAAPASNRPPGASISATAQVPDFPSSPNTRLAYLLGSVLALCGGLTAVVLAEVLMFRARPVSRRDRFDALSSTTEVSDRDVVRGTLEPPLLRRQSARQTRGSSTISPRALGLKTRWRVSIVLGMVALIGICLAAGLMMINRSDTATGAHNTGILPSWFTGKDDAPPSPVPTVEPLVLMDVTPQTALQLNAAVPISPGPIVAARPFQFAGTAEDREAARKCLAAAVYYEAGDSPMDQYAVAQVVLNRARHPAFPKTICGVVFQGAERSTGCQFSFACDGSLSRRRPSAGAWTRALNTADAALSGFVFSLVGTATHYHTDWVFPYWQATLDKIAKLHTHIFYRWEGWWGTLKAFSGNVRGTEIVDPRVLAFAGAGEVANLPSTETTAPQPGVTDVKPTEPAPWVPVGVPGVPAGLLKGNVAYLVSDRADVVVLKLDAGAFSGSFAVVGHSICGDRSPCTVVGYLSDEQMPKSLPLTADSLRRADFMFRHSSSNEAPEMRWNCTKFPRASSNECR